jgi:hypothetical protein
MVLALESASLTFCPTMFGGLAALRWPLFPVALGFFSGLFIYAATVNLLPSAHGLAPSRAVPATLLGAAAMLLIAQFA